MTEDQKGRCGNYISMDGVGDGSRVPFSPELLVFLHI